MIDPEYTKVKHQSCAVLRSDQSKGLRSMAGSPGDPDPDGFPAAPAIGREAPRELRPRVCIKEDRSEQAKRAFVEAEIRGNKLGDAGVVTPGKVAGRIRQHPENKNDPTICHGNCGTSYTTPRLEILRIRRIQCAWLGGSV